MFFKITHIFHNDKHFFVLEIVYVSVLLTIYLLPARLCKPFKEREIRINSEQNPCHALGDPETNDPAERSNKTFLSDKNLRQLADRIEGLQINIAELKKKVNNLI
jgi:hypothetical protein